MKNHILFCMLCVWTIDSFAKPKRQAPTAATRSEQFEAAAANLPCPPNSLATSPAQIALPTQNVEEFEDGLGSRQSAHSSPLAPKSPANRSETTTPEWIEAKTEFTVESTPLSDLIKSWQMWFKEKVQDPKLQDRLKRFFNLTKTYEIFSEELAQCSEERRQEAFDSLIKVFNTSEAPLFGYELLSEAITQAINDRQEAKLHQLTECAIPHRKHLPPAILDAANRFLKNKNETDVAGITAELAAALLMIHRRAQTIKKIERPTSTLADLTENNAQDIADQATWAAAEKATNNFIQRKTIE